MTAGTCGTASTGSRKGSGGPQRLAGHRLARPAGVDTRTYDSATLTRRPRPARQRSGSARLLAPTRLGAQHRQTLRPRAPNPIGCAAHPNTGPATSTPTAATSADAAPRTGRGRRAALRRDQGPRIRRQPQPSLQVPQAKAARRATGLCRRHGASPRGSRPGPRTFPTTAALSSANSSPPVLR